MNLPRLRRGLFEFSIESVSHSINKDLEVMPKRSYDDFARGFTCEGCGKDKPVQEFSMRFRAKSPDDDSSRYYSTPIPGITMGNKREKRERKERNIDSICKSCHHAEAMRELRQARAKHVAQIEATCERCAWCQGQERPYHFYVDDPMTCVDLRALSENQLHAILYRGNFACDICHSKWSRAKREVSGRAAAEKKRKKATEEKMKKAAEGKDEHDDSSQQPPRKNRKKPSENPARSQELRRWKLASGICATCGALAEEDNIESFQFAYIGARQRAERKPREEGKQKEKKPPPRRTIESLVATQKDSLVSIKRIVDASCELVCREKCQSETDT